MDTVKEMRFLVRLGNEKKYTPADTKPLTSLAYEAARPFGGDIGNLRVSSSAVELDLLLDSKTNLNNAVQALEGGIGKLLTSKQLDLPTRSLESSQAVNLGLTLFDEERYWESHEALEAAWRQSAGPEKDILQGIILLAVALVHLQKNELEIALSVMKRAHAKLASYQGEHFSVDISKIKGKVEQMLTANRPEFFKIKGNG